MRKGWLFTLAALVALIALAAVASPATAQQAAQALQISARNTTAEADGRDALGDVALPGDVLEYTLAFTNLQSEALERVVLTDPIPAGLQIVLGSAGADQDGVAVEFSLDDGGSWASSPTIRVEQAGQTVERPAPAAEYTHIRWTLSDRVAPGATVTARFRASATGAAGGGR